MIKKPLLCSESKLDLYVVAVPEPAADRVFLLRFKKDGTVYNDTIALSGSTYTDGARATAFDITNNRLFIVEDEMDGADCYVSSLSVNKKTASTSLESSSFISSPVGNFEYARGMEFAYNYSSVYIAGTDNSGDDFCVSRLLVDQSTGAFTYHSSFQVTTNGVGGEVWQPYNGDNYLVTFFRATGTSSDYMYTVNPFSPSSGAISYTAVSAGAGGYNKVSYDRYSGTGIMLTYKTGGAYDVNKITFSSTGIITKSTVYSSYSFDITVQSMWARNGFVYIYGGDGLTPYITKWYVGPSSVVKVTERDLSDGVYDRISSGGDIEYIPEMDLYLFSYTIKDVDNNPLTKLILMDENLNEISVLKTNTLSRNYYTLKYLGKQTI